MSAHRWRHGSCRRPPRGWFCTLNAGHAGPCPTIACWWNIPGRRAGWHGWGGLR